jgi:UDP-sugar transporter A1/2/3
MQIIPFKYVILLLLVFQNCAHILILKKSRIPQNDDETIYIASTSVLMTEIGKLLISLMVLLYKKGGGSFLVSIKEDIVDRKKESLKLLLPALLYSVQNNLLIISITNLDPAIFQTTYQLKVATTAFFASRMLNKRLSTIQWWSVLLLMFGVIVVQLSQQNGTSTGNQKVLVGLIATLLATCSSGFSGIYLEKMYKHTGINIWVRNGLLAYYSCILATIPIFYKDFETITRNGFFQGYNVWTWVAILVNIFGGFLISYVVRYADSILKTFATSCAMILSSFLSSYFFGFMITPFFLCGAIMVAISVYTYGTNPYAFKILPV